MAYPYDIYNLNPRNVGQLDLTQQQILSPFAAYTRATLPAQHRYTFEGISQSPAGLMDMGMLQSQTEEDQIAAAGARFKNPNELGFMPGGSMMPTARNVVVEDVMPQDNPNYLAEVAPEAAPRRTLGLLGDMFGGASALDEYMTPEQRAQLQNQGVMAAAMQLLAASGPSRTPVGLGQALGEAYGAGQKGYTAAQQNLLTSMTMKQKMDEYKRARDIEARISGALIGEGAPAMPGAAISPEQAINAPGLPAGPTVARAAMIGAPSAAAPMSQADMLYNRYTKASNIAAQYGDTAKATAYATLADKARPTVKTSGQPQQQLVDGKVQMVQYYDNGTYKVVSGIGQVAKPQGAPIMQVVNGVPTMMQYFDDGTSKPLTGVSQFNPPSASITDVEFLTGETLAGAGAPGVAKVQDYRKSAAGSTNVQVDTGDKTRAVEINKDIVAEMGSLTAQARAAKETLMNVDRVLPALDKAITGPLADYRTTLTRVGQYMGITGKDTNEILANTQNVVQGLAQQELNAASYTKGQGTLTGPEREMLKRSAAGDQNMSAAELRTALIAAQKMAQYRIGEQQQYLSKFSALPGSEQYVPFYTVTPYQPAGGGNAVQNAIDAELQRRAQTQRGGGMR